MKAERTTYSVFKYFLLIAGLIGMSSRCRESQQQPMPSYGKVYIHFVFYVGNERLQATDIESKRFVSTENDTFSIQELKFYISSVGLKACTCRSPASVYLEKQYTLIDAVGKQGLNTNGKEGIFEEGVYDTLVLGLGVDKEANRTIQFEGDLNPNGDMAWDWNTGYKFLSFVGKHYAGSTVSGLVYHIGTDSNFRMIKIPWQNGIDVRSDKEVRLLVKVDVLELFHAPHRIDFDVLNEAMFGPEASLVADNYTEGFLTEAK